MELIFTSNGSAVRGHTEAGLELFSIHLSTARGQEYVTLSAHLPGMPQHTTIDAPAGTSKYSIEVRGLAIEKAHAMLEDWLRTKLGVDAAVTVVREY